MRCQTNPEAWMQTQLYIVEMPLASSHYSSTCLISVKNNKCFNLLLCQSLRKLM